MTKFSSLLALIAIFGWISLLSGHRDWLSVAAPRWGPVLTLYAVTLALVAIARLAAAGKSPSAARERLWSWRDLPLWLLVAALWSGTLADDPQGIDGRMYLHLAATLLAVFYAGRHLLLERSRWRTAARVIAGMSGAVALYGILEVIFASNPLYESAWTRPYWTNRFYALYQPLHRPLATHFSPVTLGTYLTVSIPFVVHAARGASGRARLAFFAILGLDVVCLVLAFSRGPILALAAMAFCYLIWRRRWALLAGAAAAVAALMAVAPYLPGQASRLGFHWVLFGFNGIFSSDRFERMGIAAAMFADHPLFGVGFRQFRLRFEEYSAGTSGAPQLSVIDNMYVTLLAETGLLGALAFGLFFGSIVWRGFTAAGRARRPADAALAMTLAMALVGLAVSLGHYELLYLSGPAMLFSLICGFVSGAETVLRPDREPPSPAPAPGAGYSGTSRATSRT